MYSNYVILTGNAIFPELILLLSGIIEGTYKSIQLIIILYINTQLQEDSPLYMCNCWV